MANRYSSYSNPANSGTPRSAVQQSTQVSTTSLLDALHTVYQSGQTYPLDASTSLAVSTWLTASTSHSHGDPTSTFDRQLAVRAWEHVRRRAEDSCIILGTLHHSTPSVFALYLSNLPFPTPAIVQTALGALRPFITCVTPFNASTSRQSALAATLSVSLNGTLTGISLALSKSGIDVDRGLFNLPSESGYRAFDVFYYLFTSASTPAEKEFLGLKSPSSYSLLKKTSTYRPPAYLYNVDDNAAAEDFRGCLKEIGIKGADLRGLLSVLAGILKFGEALDVLINDDVLEDVCEDVGELWGVEPESLIQLDVTQRELLISSIYELLVDWVIGQANESIKAAVHGGDYLQMDDEETDNVSFTVVEIPNEHLARAIALRSTFDDTLGINAEMKEDGIEVIPAGQSVLQHMSKAVSEVEADLAMKGSPVAKERGYVNDKKKTTLEKIAVEAEVGGFLRKLVYPVEGQDLEVDHHRFDLPYALASSRVWFQISLHPTDEPPARIPTLASANSTWSAGTVSRQLRDCRLPEWANRRNRHLDFTADFDYGEFTQRYSQLGCQDGRDGIENWILERGWSNGEVVIGNERVWMRESAWWEAEAMLDAKSTSSFLPFTSMVGDPRANPFETGYSSTPPEVVTDNYFPAAEGTDEAHQSRENLLDHRQSSMTLGGSRSLAPTVKKTLGGDYGLGPKGDDHRGDPYYDEDMGQYHGELDPEFGDPKKIETKPIGTGRRMWVSLVWMLTFWIPSPMLRYIGRMKRPDVRMAWREKLVLVLLIFLLNALVVFYIIEFGLLLCPNYNKAWNAKQVSYHQGQDDFYVSIHGKVYDITKFWKLQHSDNGIDTTSSNMLPFAGQNLDAYFPPPLSRACSGLDVDDTVTMQNNDTTAVQYSEALHTSGPILQSSNSTALHSWNWYSNKFVPKIEEYYKGDLVVTKHNVTMQAQNDQRYWVIINQKIYDLTNYFYTLDLMNGYSTYEFFPDAVTQIFQNHPGEDVTDRWGDSVAFQNSLTCLDNAFYAGKVDFRQTPRCQVNNYILLAFTIILCAVILVKFLAAMQLGSKRKPAPQDKFVICQVPAYTEGEDQLRKGLDSLTALQYDNKRKLICVICDGMIVGGGNDRPTPKIVLDILGVDPKIDPPALPFRSVGTGSEQLNYGKVYSGLYEFEGNVVPYIVVVKVGKESEQPRSKPGNRGKRDSQVLLLQFLNRVHHRAPMSPLELEMFHQINNIIGVDPELYEYLLMVDADTNVREDSLNRLVASCANDAKIAGICGETSLENEERSWWTMIQVYEYYISHHLAKSFESLFGSVTCLPGCFCMYRLRTSDKGRPLIISDKVIAEYADGQVDTLHKKNLLALGEDRYLTTLMTKHFPAMSFKFLQNACALTAAPDTWSVLLSQRRRWINSTIHNLAELVLLKDLCGFCCFSMRFVVFIDLFGTIILPATTVYIAYLIYKVAAHEGQFPLISIIMIAAVYGLQALVFIIRRQWQHVGWMIIYILAFPVYSFILPIYSFWNQDNFSWGNTRVVIGEKGNKQVIAVDDEGFDPRSIPLQRWDDYATTNNLPGPRGNVNATFEKYYDEPYAGDAGYEMDDMNSVYSSVKPASTVLTGFPLQHPSMGPYMAPPLHRQSVMSNMTQYRDQPVSVHGKPTSITNISGNRASMGGYHMNRPSLSGIPTSGTPVSMAGIHSRGVSIDFRGSPGGGPDEFAIVDAIRSCLAEVDLESVTKKQVRALVEHRLQAELTGEKRAFLDRQIDNELANM